MPRGIYKHPPQCGFQKGHRINVGRKFSEEHKRKIGEANKGKLPWSTGKHLSQKTRLKISLAHRGKKVSKETRDKLREINKNHWCGTKNPKWKGGQIVSKDGYILILQPSHPRLNKTRYVNKSHLIMEKSLGRYLKPEEVVHHINGIKNDDRLENLMLFSNPGEHRHHHAKVSKQSLNYIS